MKCVFRLIKLVIFFCRLRLCVGVCVIVRTYVSTRAYVWLRCFITSFSILMLFFSFIHFFFWFILSIFSSTVIETIQPCSQVRIRSWNQTKLCNNGKESC